MVPCGMGVGVEDMGGIGAALGTKRAVAFDGVPVGTDGVVEAETGVKAGGAAGRGAMVIRGTVGDSVAVVSPGDNGGCWSGRGIEVSRIG